MRSTSTDLTTSGNALPKIAAMGTMIRQLNMTKMRNANTVEDSIPSVFWPKRRVRHRALLAKHTGEHRVPTPRGDRGRNHSDGFEFLAMPEALLLARASVLK